MPVRTAMLPDEIRGAGDAVSDVVTWVVDATQGMHAEIAGRGFARTARLLGPLVAPVRAVHDTVADVSYAGVRVGLRSAIATTARIVAQRHDGDGTSVMDEPRGSHVVAVVNGIIGDRLAEQHNPLDMGLELRHEGRALPPTPEALRAAHPDACGRIAVFVPGLCETEAGWAHRAEEWHVDVPATHGDRLHRDLGITPLWVRYNSGRRVSTSGADLDDLLTAVTRNWPVDVEEVVLVGYSMGGLIVRSAVHRASAGGAAWSELVSHVVCLGTPHHGAPWEKLGNATTSALGVFAETRPLAAFFNRRSAGIKDLRYGNVNDDDWLDHPPDALLRDTRVATAVVDGIPHHAIAGTVSAGRLGRVLGDFVVGPSSATGRHRRRTLTFDGPVELGGVSHLALRNHPAVYAALLTALGGAPEQADPAGAEP